MVGIRTTSRFPDQLGIHCQLFMQSLDTLWRVPQVPKHGLEIYPVGSSLPQIRSLVHGIVESRCQYWSILDCGHFEAERALIVGQSHF